METGKLFRSLYKYPESGNNTDRKNKNQEKVARRCSFHIRTQQRLWDVKGSKRV